jgi:hypothetical protein
MATTEHGTHAVTTEPDRVSTKIVVGFAVLLTAVTIGAAVLIVLLFQGLQRGALRKDAATVAAQGVERPLDRLPPAPRLEVHGDRHWRDFRAAEERRLATYGWMDRSMGAVHLPIERAIDLIAERGVAPLPPAPVTVPGYSPTPPASGVVR